MSQHTSKKFPLNSGTKLLALAALGLAATTAAHAALSVTNGNFEDVTDFVTAAAGTSATVTSWFSVTSGDFFANTWHDTRDAEVPTDVSSGYTGDAAAAFSGAAGDGTSGLNGSWLYQSIGTDATASALDITFDWGDFGNIPGSSRDLGITVSVYEMTGSFTAANNTDVNGAAGVTLLDSASFTLNQAGAPAKLTIGETATLNISSQTGGELFLRFNNWDAGADTPWLMLDNVSLSVVPEPGTYALLAGLAALSFIAIRRRK